MAARSGGRPWTTRCPGGRAPGPASSGVESSVPWYSRPRGANPATGTAVPRPDVPGTNPPGGRRRLLSGLSRSTAAATGGGYYGGYYDCYYRTTPTAAIRWGYGAFGLGYFYFNPFGWNYGDYGWGSGGGGGGSYGGPADGQHPSQGETQQRLGLRRRLLRRHGGQLRQLVPEAVGRARFAPDRDLRARATSRSCSRSTSRTTTRSSTRAGWSRSASRGARDGPSAQQFQAPGDAARGFSVRGPVARDRARVARLRCPAWRRPAGRARPARPVVRRPGACAADSCRPERTVHPGDRRRVHAALPRSGALSRVSLGDGADAEGRRRGAVRRGLPAARLAGLVPAVRRRRRHARARHAVGAAHDAKTARSALRAARPCLRIPNPESPSPESRN
ncbi:MAG: hypothetical protein MZV64_13620 [Ignavibacteriales bacterium]|nr:hypothetical protein [Ignavibacteriales bacterium]